MPDAETIERYRRMSPQEKFQLIDDLTVEAQRAADEHELRMRLASRRLGADVVKKHFGWPPDPEG